MSQAAASTMHDVIELQRKRLRLVGSTKDPALFQARRAAVRDEASMNRTIIVNFADEDTRFGCRFTCKFCSWRDRATEMGEIVPTYDALTDFLKDFQGVMVTVSGGGDPLFKWEQNRHRLKQLIDTIHSLGFLVEVVTKEIFLAAELAGGDEVIDSIDAWSLSVESAGKTVSRVKTLAANDQLVRVSKVCSPGVASGGKLAHMVGEYAEAGAYAFVMREDFYAGPTAEDAPFIAGVLKQHRIARWLPNRLCSDNLFLIRDIIHHGDTALGAQPS